MARVIATKKKRIKRRKQTAEDFTPLALVNQMLDKLPKTSWEDDKTFCDPACGTGHMLIEVFKRKLAHGHDPLEALKTVYGVDIQDDNIRETRLKLLKLVRMQGKRITKKHIIAVIRNIVVCRLSKYPNGALDYDFRFPLKTCTEKDIQPWLDGIYQEGWLDKISVDGDNYELAKQGIEKVA